MQKTFDQIKAQLWGRLKPYFDKFAGQNGQIKNSQVQILIRDVFDDASQSEIDYIIKNMHRLDPDGSGYVSFGQFANFLFKTHCGQLSLQRRHIKGKMVRGSQRLMNLQEFNILLNDAVSFLKVQVPKDISTAIFEQTDADKDGNITYVQYFRAIDKYICKSKTELEQEGKKIKQEVVFPEPQKKTIVQRRFRNYIWMQLRKLYQAFAMGRSVLLSELRRLIISICTDLTETQISYILSGLYMLQGQYIDFVQFASRFLYLLAEIGLSRFSLNRSRNLRTLTLEDFIILMFNSWKYFNIRAITGSFLSLIYTSILRKRTTVSYEMYLEWINHYLSVIYYYGGVFDFPQDQIDSQSGDKLFFEIKAKPYVNPSSPKKIKNEQIIQFVFSNHDLAYLVRQRMLEALIKYDINKDHLFSEDEIRLALKELMKENQYQLDYVTKNVFRYDIDGDKNVTYDQLTNFSVEQHFGQMAIQRLHRKKFYSRGSERIMNEAQFGKTLNYALKVLDIEASPQQISTLFKQIDLDNDGWIPYEIYFLFLMYYFGSKSFAYLNPKQTKTSLTFYEELMKVLEGLKGMDRFLKLLMYQLRLQFLLFDDNGNLSFEPHEIEAILMHLFKFNEIQIRMIMREIFRVNISYQTTIGFDDLAAIILNIYFVYIVCLRRFENVGRSGWKKTKISQAQFIVLMTQACYFLSIKPFQEDLIIIFKFLDTDNDGYITIEQYIAFIRKFIGKGLSLHDQPPQVASPVKNKPTAQISDEQFEFVSAIWDQLKALFDRYDQGKKEYLSQQQFKLFAVQVLNEKSDNDLKYIFWNLFRLDSNFDKKIGFNEFAPYVLKHAGQISLQRFHLQQVKGKSTLTEDELFIVISNAYRFLSTMPKSRSIIGKIYSRIAKANGVDYGSYLTWISKAVAARYN